MNENNSTQPSALKIIMMGQLMINLPVTAVILISWIILYKVGLGWVLSTTLSSGIGWYFWGKLLDHWKNWALGKNVDRERIYRLGKWGMLNYYRYRIFDEEKKENS